jgi:hypothetical protein
MPRPQLVSSGVNGFDTNTVVSPTIAAALKKHGYRFALRYIPRVTQRANDLTRAEVDTLHRAGLAVGIVQHVESAESWMPSEQKGHDYGRGAAAACRALALPAGVTVWCDLEGVSTLARPGEIDRYCRLWYAHVKAAGYEPGLYVGWRAGLDARALYRLPFARYWSAYNLNADERPAVVGVCMKQRAAKPGDLPLGAALSLDTDLVTGDLLGRVPTMWAPDEWDVRKSVP